MARNATLTPVEPTGPETDPAARRPGVVLPVVLYLVVTFALSAVAPLVQELSGVDDTLVRLVMFAPALGALATVLVLRRRGGFRFRPWAGFSVGRTAGALLAAVVIVGLTAGGAALAGNPLPLNGFGTLAVPVAVMLTAQFVGACGEELGWRCFLQPTLRTRLSPVATGVLVGLIWGLWHVQIFAFGPLYVLGYLASTVGVSVTLSVLLDGRRVPLLLAAAGVHFVLNVGLFVMGDDAAAALVPTLASGAAALLVAALVTTLRRR